MFVHLHRHSEWSLLDGVGTGDQYAEKAAQLGQSSLAITDHGTLAGALYHIQACEKHDIKPILGMEAYFRQDITRDRRDKAQNNYFHLILLAKNSTGWRNLMRLSSAGYFAENFYQRPCIDWKILRDNSEGLIASTACVSGIVPKAVIENNEKEARRLLSVFHSIFRDDFFLEIQPHDFAEQSLVNMWMINIAQEIGLPVVATQDVHYPEKGWEDTQEIVKLISTNKGFDVGALKTLWLTSEDEIKDLFRSVDVSIPEDYINEAVNNSGMIADRVEHFKIDKSPKIPKATNSALEAERILRKWCREGLERIGKIDDPVYLDRLETEFNVLRKLKVMDYFVIVGDMVRWAKDQGIRVGPGRGSAVGCLINYLIRITAIDPIGYGLLFERFMNEYRPELPDIDIDFQDDRRDEVKDYLREKWGDEYVVDIAAFQSFGLRAVISDIARVLNVPYPHVRKAADTVPDKTFGMSVADLEKQSKEVAAFFEKYPEVKKHAYRLHGQIKGLSKHAAAVIVTNQPAIDLIPMMRAKDGSLVTQWSERANGQLISPYGFLKIDALATDALTTQARAIKLIKERHGVDIDFEDIKQFPVMESPDFAEQDVVESFSNGALLGVFQFGNSAGIKALLRDIQPTHLNHIIACNALYRPGTLSNGLAQEYAYRKNGKHWKLIHDAVAPYLSETFGIMVFQEQVMQMYRALGKDVDPNESGIFLKVVSKGIARDLKGKERLQAYYEKFALGCSDLGIPKKAYDEVWSQILQMTTYAFNKSHATGYGFQAYQDKWLKEKWKLEEYSALLTTESTEFKKIPPFIREARNVGVAILPPDINTSDVGFTIDGNSVRFGLLAIKDVAGAAISHIKEYRPFVSYQDFFDRVPKAKVNKKVKKALYEAGAFDSLGGRTQWVLDEDAIMQDGSLDISTRANLEIERLGVALSRDSDIVQYKEIIKDYSITAKELSDSPDGEEVAIGGEVLNVKEIKTKNGGLMAMAEIGFEQDDFKLTIWPEKYKQYQHLLGIGNAVMALGEWDSERQTTVVNNMCTVKQLAEEVNAKV